MDTELFADAVSAGFQKVKVKMGRNLNAEVDFIKRMADRYPELRWRIAFNGTQQWEVVEKILVSFGDELCRKIDFLEDAWTEPVATHGGVPLAVDRYVEDSLENFSVAVLKPAINEMQSLLKRADAAGKHVVVTSYMDHPLGQSYAAWQAALATHEFPDLLDSCGLITHGLFQPDVFIDALGVPAPDFNVPAGTGLGFDDLLENLRWKRWV